MRIGDTEAVIEVVGVGDDNVRIRVVGDDDLSALVAQGTVIPDRRDL